MIRLIPILLSLSVLCTSLTAVEYGKLKANDKIIILDGDTFEVLNFQIIGNVYNMNDYTICSFNDNEGFSSDYRWYYNADNELPGDYAKFCGSGEITAKCNLFYKLTRASEVKTVTNSITIPAIADQEWAVTLERSTDLVNWETVAPGTVMGTDGLQFFRLRVGGETTTVESTSTGGE